MVEKCNPVTTIAATTTTTVTPTTTSNDDVAIALTTLATTGTVDDQTIKADVGAVNANTSGIKKPKGRRGKVKMAKMEKENNLLVTFSKRKSGLIKKANELCTMCGVQCALVVFSPAAKVFSFGHPSVDQVAERYLSGNPNPIFASQDDVGNQVMPHGLQTGNTEDLVGEFRELEESFEASKKHEKEMDERRVAKMESCWWERPLQQLNASEIQILKRTIVDVKSKVFDMAKLRSVPLTSSSSSSPCPSLGLGLNYPNFHGAGGVGTFLSFGGFPRWNNYNDGPDKAGPSGHASDGWGGNSVGSLGGSLGGHTGLS